MKSMLTECRTERRGTCLEPTDSSLISDPLAFIAEEHLRLRQICAMLIAVANDPAPEFKAMGLCLGYLRHEFLLHLADEGTGLFPAMEKRCEPEDEIGLIISRIRDDHADAQEMAKGVCCALEGAMEGVMAGPGAATDEQRVCMKLFAAKCQRYLIWENAIILRLAKARLHDDDLTALARQMLLRRGLIEPGQR